MSTAAATVIDLLERAGVTRFYTVPGESFLELMDEVDRRPGLRLISTRHESGAAFMAEADAKVTGRPAVAMATRAVGAANLAIGVHTARQDSTPMIALLGQVETDHLGKEAFQEVDLPRFYDEITVFGATVHRPDRAAEIVSRALLRSTGPRPGPAVVAFPADVLAGAGLPADPPVPISGPAATDGDVGRAFDLLAAAERPVVIVGEGVPDGHHELTELAEAFGLGVYAAFRRQDTFPNDHRHYLGHLALGTPAEITGPLRDADVVLVMGSRLDEVTTQAYTLPAAGPAVVQVDAAAENLGAVVTPRLAVHASPLLFARELTRLAADRRHRSAFPWQRARAGYERFSTPETVPVEGEGLHPTTVMTALRAHLPGDSIVANDAGNFSVFGHRYWRFNHPRTQVAPISGAMGYAVPAAVAASLAAPGRTVLGLVGDGGFLMTGQELETAARCGAGPLVVVFQNGLYGTIAMHQARSTGRPAAVDISPADLGAFARSLGATARTVDEAGELDDAVRELLATPGPRVLVARTAADVLTPSATLSGLLGGRA
ncbi:thiamine pyrophosphate-dependent enzyme [Pseudonocardia adelaidensis]|uniref:Thiamine pyrophosphate-binding protein n=1 Tax=Pseudonocardia adelaidensis TaxID=648754 RepID=A0ABP9NE17_9PSEU